MNLVPTVEYKEPNWNKSLMDGINTLPSCVRKQLKLLAKQYHIIEIDFRDDISNYKVGAIYMKRDILRIMYGDIRYPFILTFYIENNKVIDEDQIIIMNHLYNI